MQPLQDTLRKASEIIVRSLLLIWFLNGRNPSYKFIRPLKFQLLRENYLGLQKRLKRAIPARTAAWV